MKKQEILNKMKELHAEYKDLAQKLSELEGPERRASLEKDQRRIIELFKKELLVEATEQAKPIDWAEIEEKVFNDSNLNEVVTTNTGWLVNYDDEGQPGLSSVYVGGGKFTPFAYDKLDAERYVKRQKRKQKFASSKR